MTVRAALARALPADVAVAQGQAHGAAAAEGPAGRLNVAVAEVAHQDSGSARAWASSPSRSSDSVAERDADRRPRRDRTARARPGHAQPGGVPPLTWPKDRVRIASARRSGRSSAQLLAREVHDPGIGFVTLTRVKVSPDLQLGARVLHDHRRRARRARTRTRRSTRATPFLRRQIGAASGCAACRSCASSSTQASSIRTGSSSILLELAEPSATRATPAPDGERRAPDAGPDEPGDPTTRRTRTDVGRRRRRRASRARRRSS